jgi:hypothetical protein
LIFNAFGYLQCGGLFASKKWWSGDGFNLLRIHLQPWAGAIPKEAKHREIHGMI